MALFMGIHDMGGTVAVDAVVQNWDKYKEACVEMGCTPQHAHYNAGQGKAFCITEADSADTVQKAHDNANVPVNEILEIKDLS
jgi:hypothetical protein